MYKWLNAVLCIFAVTPHAGVRIEIWTVSRLRLRSIVTPHAGVRIEMIIGRCWISSPPVTPHAGVRIEMEDPP